RPLRPARNTVGASPSRAAPWPAQRRSACLLPRGGAGVSPTKTFRPLEGIRVVEMTWMWAAPHAGLQLAELGAEVIRIESNNRPCMNRRVPPYPPGMEPGLNRGGSFNEKNQQKKSVLLDIKKPEALQLARELVAKSDVLMENFAVGVIDRIGMGYDVLSKL